MKACVFSFCLAAILAIGLTNSAFGQCGGASVTAANNLDISKRTGNDSESHIGINPANPQQLFACVNPSSGSTLGTWRSSDGGTTWVAAAPITSACCDAQVAWDALGNLFVVYINSSVNAVLVVFSTNGGASFSAPITVGTGSIDQPSIAVGPGAGGVGNAVWVDWNLSGSMRVSGAVVSGLGSVGAFSAAVAPPTASGSFGGIAVGPQGQVSITYESPTGGQGPATIFTNTDPDGLGGVGFGARVTATTTNVGGFDFIPAQNGRSIDSECGLAWDRSGGAFNGRLYLVYTEETVNENNDTEIYVRISNNNGSTWSAPTRVNDDTLGNGKSQFLPVIALDQSTGVVGISWMDCRNSAGNNTAQQFASISTDGGATWQANVQVSVGLSNASTAGSGVDYGDYQGAWMAGNTFFPCWSDNSGSLPGYVGSPQFDLGTNKITITSGVNTPTSPNASPASICGGDSSSLSATVGAGETVDWYTGSCGGVAVPGGANPSVNPGSTTTYFARARNTTSGCVSNSCAQTTVTVNAAPAVPGSPGAAPNVICSGASTTLSATVGVDETVDWFTDGCGVTPVPGGANPSVSPVANTTYYARARNTSTGCINASCSFTTVSISPPGTGDFDMNGSVKDNDLAIFVNILLNPGGPQDCIADMNLDGNVDGLDVPGFDAAYLAS